MSGKQAGGNISGTLIIDKIFFVMNEWPSSFQTKAIDQNNNIHLCYFIISCSHTHHFPFQLK